jgi:hypothetical protein
MALTHVFPNGYRRVAADERAPQRMILDLQNHLFERIDALTADLAAERKATAGHVSALRGELEDERQARAQHIHVLTEALAAERKAHADSVAVLRTELETERHDRRALVSELSSAQRTLQQCVSELKNLQGAVQPAVEAERQRAERRRAAAEAKAAAARAAEQKAAEAKAAADLAQRIDQTRTELLLAQKRADDLPPRASERLARVNSVLAKRNQQIFAAQLDIYRCQEKLAALMSEQAKNKPKALRLDSSCLCHA